MRLRISSKQPGYLGSLEKIRFLYLTNTKGEPR